MLLFVCLSLSHICNLFIYTHVLILLGNSQYGITKGKLFHQPDSLDSLGIAMNVSYLDISKVFGAASQNILIDKVMKYELEEWTMRKTENCLDSRL